MNKLLISILVASTTGAALAAQVAAGSGPATDPHGCSRGHTQPEGASEKGEDSPSADKEQDEEKPVDWAKILFFTPTRSIRSIRLTIEPEDGLWLTPKAVVIESADRAVCKRIEQGLLFPLRIAIPDTGPVKVRIGSTSGVFGRMVVKVTDTAPWEGAKAESEFVVDLSGAGFVLDGGCATFGNMFFSYVLAQQVDELYHAKTGRHLSKKLLDELAGKTYISDQENAWRSMQKDSRASETPRRQSDPRKE